MLGQKSTIKFTFWIFWPPGPELNEYLKSSSAIGMCPLKVWSLVGNFARSYLSNFELDLEPGYKKSVWIGLLKVEQLRFETRTGLKICKCERKFAKIETAFDISVYLQNVIESKTSQPQTILSNDIIIWIVLPKKACKTFKKFFVCQKKKTRIRFAICYIVFLIKNYSITA